MHEDPSRRSVLLGAPAAAVGATIAAPSDGAASPAPSSEYQAYRRAFDDFQVVCDRHRADAASRPYSTEEDAIHDAYFEAYDTMRHRPVLSWSDVAELAIVAHDHTWDRFAQTYIGRNCPHDLVTALILAVLTMQPGDATLHRRPEGVVSSLRGSFSAPRSTTISN